MRRNRINRLLCECVHVWFFRTSLIWKGGLPAATGNSLHSAGMMGADGGGRLCGSGSTS